MKFLEFILAIILIYFGILLINYYQRLKKENKIGGLSFKLQTAGIGFIIIGVTLIIRLFVFLVELQKG
ncbi:hypothetical protein ACFO3U_06805 [Flavobacterium ponti]|uniref:Uncharacterized protein n=1 Tax=Flavobacterium ponti TaxID=665133 RepID=A0ABV9P3C9_9FLAO